MNIKANSVTNLSDARYFAAQYSVEFLGFCLDEGNEAYLNPFQIHAMRGWIEGPKIVGEFGLQSEVEVLESINEFKLDAIQLSMFSTLDGGIFLEQVTVIQELVIEKDCTAAKLLQWTDDFGTRADLLLLDFEKNAWQFADIVRSQEISLDLLQRICQKHKVIVAINATAAQLKTLAQSIQPQAIALKGGEEERIGYKSFDELNHIFEVLEEI